MQKHQYFKDKTLNKVANTIEHNIENNNPIMFGTTNHRTNPKPANPFVACLLNLQSIIHTLCTTYDADGGDRERDDIHYHKLIEKYIHKFSQYKCVPINQSTKGANKHGNHRN